MRNTTICALLLVSAAFAAQADTFVVDTEVDGMLTGCNDLVIGDCSLRGAIEKANQTPGFDTITFGFSADHFALTLTGFDDLNQTGDLDILEEVQIVATAPVVIDASALGDRVFDLHTNTSEFTGFENLRITGGGPNPGDPPLNGAGIRCLDSALFFDGGEVYDNGPAFDGGGVYAESCEIVLNFVTVRDNVATRNGGGLDLFGSSLTAPVSAIVGNQAGAFGGGLIASLSSVVELDNSTLSGNVATNGGSAIATSGQLGLDFVTVVSDGGVSAIAHPNNGATTTLSNTVIVGACEAGPGNTIVSGGGNLESPGDTCGLGPSVDLIGVADARLMPLSVAGSATPYHLPMSDSPAVDDPLGTTSGCPTHDQRFGPSRPLDGNGDGIAACDIGAIERDPLFQDGFESGDTSRWSSTVGLQ